MAKSTDRMAKSTDDSNDWMFFILFFVTDFFCVSGEYVFHIGCGRMWNRLTTLKCNPKDASHFKYIQYQNILKWLWNANELHTEFQNVDSTRTVDIIVGKAYFQLDSWHKWVASNICMYWEVLILQRAHSRQIREWPKGVGRLRAVDRFENRVGGGNLK